MKHNTPTSEPLPTIRFPKATLGFQFYSGIINRLFYSFLFKFIPAKWKFQMIYNFNLWSSPESISGPGSEVLNTIRVREFLTQFIKDYQIRTILDIPCGDFNWMKEIDLTGINYLGGDIIERIIKDNNAKYGTDNIRFEKMDIIDGKLIKADLLLVRDLFIHFSLKNVQAAVENIKRSRINYILVTTWPDSKENIAIRDGYNFNINLEIGPFNFGKPLVLIEEAKDRNSDRKCLGLWKVKDLPATQGSY